MNIQILRRGGVLLLRRDAEGAVGELVQVGPGVEERDVSCDAVAYLFEPVQLESGLSLGDVFSLVERCPGLMPVFKRQGIESLFEQAGLGPVPQQPGSDPPEIAGIEFLELSWAWTLDSRPCKTSAALMNTGVAG